eukprot:5766213-Prymnesium_polylepis.1
MAAMAAISAMAATQATANSEPSAATATVREEELARAAAEQRTSTTNKCLRSCTLCETAKSRSGVRCGLCEPRLHVAAITAR